MKAKKIASVAVPVMLLFGCGGEKTDTPKKDKASESQTVAKKVKVSKEDYPNKINDLCVEFDKLFAEYKQTTDEVMSGKKKKEEIPKKLKELNGVVDKFVEICPPSEYKETQKDVEKSMGYFRESFKLVNEVFTRTTRGSKTDKELMDEASAKLVDADKYWAKFYKSIEDNIKLGDGTITAKDLKDLDKKAGIEYDKVKENLSKDGKELVGTWGFDDPNGYIVSMVIHENGTFETYGKGEYPDKKNYLTGTWKYNPNGYAFTIHIEKSFRDGVEEEEARDVDIPYKVQNFDGKNVQFFSPKTFNTIRYVKQK
ncbi:DUF3994 domain-containing protein [Bacillus pseudomycoides]|uniref:DUF3994 domain-containing protein n=1 Tax=Bacillus bingmayongensis TaxID=1150157 RepID=A0ABU5K2A3_9BACI|nr:DUF3994 domain-containing protein [Bacillus pseudomycoides]